MQHTQMHDMTNENLYEQQGQPEGAAMRPCDAPTPERATVAGEDEERWRQGRPPGTPVSSDPAG